MESICSERFSSSSSDETECYLHPKRIKIESNQKSIEKGEQQKLEQSILCVNRYRTSPHKPVYSSERQNSWSLGKQSCDAARKTCMGEFFHFQTCNSERLPCRISENKLSTKKWSPENENQITMGDDISLNVHGWPLRTELCNVWNAANTCKNLHVLNPSQAQQNSNVKQNRNSNNELKQNSSPLSKDLLQMELLSHKSVSDQKWKKYQLLQIPFLCGTGSVFSHIEHEKNNFLEKVCSTKDKAYSNSDNETTAERDNKEKNNSSYIIPTLKPFKSIQPLEIPNFQLPSISNEINSKMPPTNLKEMDWKNFKSPRSLMQPEQIHGVQKLSETGKQQLQNDNSTVQASAVGSGFKEKNCPSVRKHEHRAVAGRGEVSVTFIGGNSTDIECNQIFTENDLKDKMLENSNGDNDQKSKIHIYISAKNVQNEKCISYNDRLKRMGRRNSNESMGMFHIQTSVPVTTEASERNKLDVHCCVHHYNSDTSLGEAESKLSTKEIFDFKRYFAKNIIFESNCPRIIVQNFPEKKVNCDVFRGKEILTLKFSFQNMLFGWVRTRTESLYKDMPTCLDGGVPQWLHFCETLNGQCGAQELVKSNVNRNYNKKTCICLLAIISKHLKVELQKTILAFFFPSTNTLLATEGRSMRVEEHPLCSRKQDQLNSHANHTLRQNTEFHRENETYPVFISSKFVESIGFELRNDWQRRHFTRSLGEESTFLKKGTLIPNQKSRLCKGRHVRKHHLFSRGSEGFSTCLRSVSHKKGMKKQILIARCLILLQGTFDCSSLNKMYYCNITKIQYLTGADLSFWSYFPAHSPLKFGKVNSKYTDKELLVTTVKQEKKKPSRMFNNSFHGEKFTTGCRNCITSTSGVTDEVTYTMKKYLGTSNYINADRKECFKSKELQINVHNIISKNSFSIFDTYEKIPLTTDSEDFDKIPVLKQDNSVKKKLSAENAVPSSKEVHHFPAESDYVLILPEQSKTMEKCNSFLLQDSRTNRPEYCKKVDTYSPHFANKNVEDQNTYLNFENVFPSSSSVYQPVTLPLGSSSFVSKDRVVSEGGHCRSSSSADKQKQSEKIHATMQCPSAGSPAMAGTYLQLQAEERVQFSAQGHTQTSKAVSSEPATLKQRLDYVKEEEEISDEQMHVTNESQCETVMNDLIMSYSEDESKTFIAGEKKLKIHLSLMNNGCLEDVKDKYLPLENRTTYEFELKRKFDLVLEELHMFHEINEGKENNLSSLETNSHSNYCELNNFEGIDENVARVSQKKICISSPICGTTEGQNITDCNESLLNKKIANLNEDRKVSNEYCISRLPSEELQHSPVAEGSFDAAYRKPYTWDPAFLSCALFQEKNYNLLKEGGYFQSHEVIRVQPLKTCKGPIRIGLSRKARPKQLHPYLK